MISMKALQLIEQCQFILIRFVRWQFVLSEDFSGSIFSKISSRATFFKQSCVCLSHGWVFLGSTILDRQNDQAETH